jgi:hypothetical protein
METHILIDKHQKCIDILDGIKHFQKMITIYEDNVNGFPGTFYSLRIKYLHNIEIYRMCIERLMKRYNAVLNELNK